MYVPSVCVSVGCSCVVTVHSIAGHDDVTLDCRCTPRWDVALPVFTCCVDLVCVACGASAGVSVWGGSQPPPPFPVTHNVSLDDVTWLAWGVQSGYLLMQAHAQASEW